MEISPRPFHQTAVTLVLLMTLTIVSCWHRTTSAELFNPSPISPSAFSTGGYVASDTSAQGSGIAMSSSSQQQSGTNLPSSFTDPLGRTTNYTYDALGNITSLTRLVGTPNAVTTSFTYDATYSNVTSITDPLGNVSTFVYDSV